MDRMLPLFDPYPLQDQLVTLEEIREHEFGLKLFPNQVRALRQQTIVYTPYEMLCDAITHTTSGITWKLEEKFRAFRSLVKTAGMAPKYKDIPHHRDYQAKAIARSQEMADELAMHGASLQTGQYLFHGGDTETPMKEFVTDGPLSLSFAPSIAVWHARCDGIGKWNRKKSSEPIMGSCPTVWILRVSSIFRTKVLFLRKGGANMADEMECVVGRGAKIQPWRKTIYQGITVVEAYVH